MDEDETANPATPATLRFGFLIEKKIQGNIQELSIQTDNQGIPEAEVILIIQAWVEKFSDARKCRWVYVRNKVSEHIRNALRFK